MKKNHSATAVSVSLLLALPYLHPAFAVTPPVGAGSVSGELLQNNPQLSAPPPPVAEGKTAPLATTPVPQQDDDSHAGPSVMVRQIKVNNVPASCQEAVQRLTASLGNRRMTLKGLKNVAVTLTALMQKHGEFLSYAYIPNQKITDGVVQINVMNGHLERINLLSNASLVRNSVINRYLARINATSSKKIARIGEDLLILSDLPGIGALSPSLARGDTPGGSLLNLELSAAPRYSGYVMVDNMGSESSGRNRAGAQLNVNSPFGLGDRFQALAFFSPDWIQTNKKSTHGNTNIARVSYDAPVSASGTRAGLSFSHVNYKLGGPVLAGLGNGFARVLTLYGSQSILRNARHNLTFSVNAERKFMNDKFWGEKNARQASILRIQFDGSRLGSWWGRGNVLQYSLAWSAGRLSNSDAWNGLNTKGAFYKANQVIKFQQRLLQGVVFNFRLEGQQASKNLDGAEKASLGGPYAVRAYSNSAVSTDNELLASAGLNVAVPGVKGLSAGVFYDYAAGKVNKFSPQPQIVHLQGSGVELNYQFNDKYFINASYAWRIGEDKWLPAQHKAMGWITAGFTF